MPSIKLVTENEASGRVKEIYEDILDAVKHLGVDDATLAEAVEVMTEVTKGNLIMHSIGGRH